MQTLCDPFQTPSTLMHPSRTLSTMIESYLMRLEAMKLFFRPYRFPRLLGQSPPSCSPEKRGKESGWV